MQSSTNPLFNENKILYKYTSLSSGQMNNAKEISFAPNEYLKEIRYYYSKGLKYLNIVTTEQNQEWGYIQPEDELYLTCYRFEEDSNLKIGIVSFGFSLTENKVGCLAFVLF